MAMKNRAKDSWRLIRRLQKGSFAHHTQQINNVFRDPDTGTIANNNRDCIPIMHKYWTRLFNRTDAPVDFSVLDEITQRPTEHDLDSPPTFSEMTDTLKQLANNKAPGESGIPIEALKALPEEGLQLLHNLLCRYWNTDNLHFEEWQTALLRIIYKNKGDQKDLINYRGIVLQDVAALAILSK